MSHPLLVLQDRLERMTKELRTSVGVRASCSARADFTRRVEVLAEDVRARIGAPEDDVLAYWMRRSEADLAELRADLRAHTARIIDEEARK